MSTSGGRRTTFHLPSVAVSCSHDRPAPELTLPVALEDRDSGFSVLEGGFPLPTRLCRFVRPQGLIGVQLAGPLPEKLVVELRLTCDPPSERRWLGRQQRNEEVNARRNVTHHAPEPRVAGFHRLLKISAQGRPMAHLLLDDPTTIERDATSQRVAFEVPTAEIDESRLLLVSLASGHGAPEWNAEGRLLEPLVGLQGTWLRVRASEGKPQVGVSTGRRGRDGWMPWSPQIGYAALNRGDHAVRLLVAHEKAAGRRLLGRRRDTEGPTGVEVAEADGTTRTLELSEPGDDGVASVVVPAGTGPAFVRFTGRTAQEPPDGLRLRAVVAG